MSMNWVLASAIAAIPAVAQDMTILPTNVPPARLYYYACTATNDDGLSDYSNEVTNTNAFVSLTWDVVTNATGYFVYRGTNSGHYLWNWPAQAGSAFAIPHPVPLTNRILTFHASVTNWPAFSVTNPATPFFVRTNVTRSAKTYTVSAISAPAVSGPWSMLPAWPTWRTNGLPQVRLWVTQEVR